MQKTKNILIPLALVLAGVIIGGLAVYNYYGFGSSQASLRKNIDLTTCNLADFQGNVQEEAPYQELSDSAAAAAYLKFRDIKSSFIPSGVPDIYGEELGISFDEVQDAIDKVRVYGPTYGTKGEKIILTGQDMERYIDIGFQISCQYCCGVKTLVKENGEAACGCAHSIMMRGLTAYLIKNHPELSDGRILEELNIWKRTYFPKQTLSTKLEELKRTEEPGIKEILEEFPDFLPQMVGGC